MENTVPETNVTPETNAAPAADPGKPVEYNLAPPEGYELPSNRLDEIASYARERGLSPEAAQELVNREHNAQQTYKNAETEKFTQARQQWIKELKEDKTYGGDKFAQTVESAKRALEKFAPQSLREVLNRTGLGDHKDLIITFARIYEQMAEDTLITRSASSQSAKPKTAEELFYGHKE